MRDLREVVADLVGEFNAWQKSKQPLLPPRIWGLAQDADAAAGEAPAAELPLVIAVGQFNENLRQWSESRPGAMQPDGTPGPRLIASAKLMRERCASPPEVVDDEDEAPSRPRPPERSLPVSTGLSGNRLTNILGMLSSLKVEEIDQEVEALQKQIDELKRLRGIIDPTTKTTNQPRPRRTAEEIAALPAEIHAHLKEKGAMKAGAIGKAFRVAWDPLKAILADKKRFKIATDGSYSAV